MTGHSFDRGGQDDGTLMVSIDKWYGDDYVTIDLIPGATEAHLTAAQARKVAADLITHADYLDGSNDAYRHVGTSTAYAAVRMPDGTMTEGCGDTVAHAITDAHQNWKEQQWPTS